MKIVNGINKRTLLILSVVFLFVIILSYSFLGLFGNDAERKPNIVIIEVCGLRPDHLPCYGYNRSTSTSICNISEDGVIFQEAVSTGTCTPVGLPSLLTGNFPLRHNIKDVGYGFTEEHTTLFDTLNENNYNLNGYAEKFTFVDNLFKDKEVEVYSNFDHFLKNMGKMEDSKRPFLFFWHSLDVHFPYRSSGYRGRYPLNESVNETYLYQSLRENCMGPHNFSKTENKYLSNRYDESILALDDRVEEIVSKLKENNLYDDTMIIFTADHGEGLGAHDQYHGGVPYKEFTRIPLIVKFPDNKYSGMKVEDMVRIVDIYPTIKDYMGLERKVEDIHGASILPILKKGEDINSTVYGTFGEELWIRTEKYKYIPEPANPLGGAKLYNLKQDPNEENNLFYEKTGVVQRLENKIKEHKIKSKKIEQEKEELTEKDKKLLRELGYLN